MYVKCEKSNNGKQKFTYFNVYERNMNDLFITVCKRVYIYCTCTNYYSHFINCNLILL